MSRPAPSVAVIGLGGVGLSSLLGAVAAGAREIVAIDLADDKLAFARELGATATFNASDPDVRRAGQERHRRRGRIRVRDSPARSGRSNSPIRSLAGGGTTVTAGLPPPTATMPLPAVTLVAEERTLKGSYIGTAVPSRDIPRFIQLYRRGRLPVDRLMTGILTLSEINQGFDRLHDGTAIRQVVKL